MKACACEYQFSEALETNQALADVFVTVLIAAKGLLRI